MRWVVNRTPTDHRSWPFQQNSHFADAGTALSQVVGSAPARSSAARHAAIDHQLRACHVAGRVGGEEKNPVRDVLRFASAAERHPSSSYLVRRIGAFVTADAGIFVQIGVSMTPMDPVDPDIVVSCRALHRTAFANSRTPPFVAQ
jgi:hypothetical protein